MQDEELCRQLQAGNGAAMEALVHRHHRSVHTYLHRLSGNGHVAEDLTQEVFIRVCSSIGSFRSTEPFRPWLYAVAHNLYRDWRRGAYQRREVSMEDMELAPGLPPPIDLTERYAERADVIHALAELDDAHRSVLLLRFFHDLKAEEISRALGIPVGTVRSRLSNALKKLRSRLTGERRISRAQQD